MILKIQPGAYLWSSETMYTYSGFVLSLSAVGLKPRGDFFERMGGVGRLGAGHNFQMEENKHFEHYFCYMSADLTIHQVVL